MHWYWWVLIGIVAFILVSTILLWIYLRFFAPPGSLALKRSKNPQYCANCGLDLNKYPATGPNQECPKISIWNKILKVILWPASWLLNKFFDKIFEDC
jgi:hypothetical protein